MAQGSHTLLLEKVWATSSQTRLRNPLAIRRADQATIGALSVGDGISISPSATHQKEATTP